MNSSNDNHKSGPGPPNQNQQQPQQQASVNSLELLIGSNPNNKQLVDLLRQALGLAQNPPLPQPNQPHNNNNNNNNQVNSSPPSPNCGEQMINNSINSNNSSSMALADSNPPANQEDQQPQPGQKPSILNAIATQSLPELETIPQTPGPMLGSAHAPISLDSPDTASFTMSSSQSSSQPSSQSRAPPALSLNTQQNPAPMLSAPQFKQEPAVSPHAHAASSLSSSSSSAPRKRSASTAVTQANNQPPAKRMKANPGPSPAATPLESGLHLAALWDMPLVSARPLLQDQQELGSSRDAVTTSTCLHPHPGTLSKSIVDLMVRFKVLQMRTWLSVWTPQMLQRHIHNGRISPVVNFSMSVMSLMMTQKQYARFQDYLFEMIEHIGYQRPSVFRLFTFSYALEASVPQEWPVATTRARLSRTSVTHISMHLYMSKAATKLLGYTPSELLSIFEKPGLPFMWALVHEIDWEKMIKFSHEAAANQRSSFTTMLRAIDKTSKIIPCVGTSCYTRDENNLLNSHILCFLPFPATQPNSQSAINRQKQQQQQLREQQTLQRYQLASQLSTPAHIPGPHTFGAGSNIFGLPPAQTTNRILDGLGSTLSAPPLPSLDLTGLEQGTTFIGHHQQHRPGTSTTTTSSSSSSSSGSSGSSSSMRLHNPVKNDVSFLDIFHTNNTTATAMANGFGQPSEEVSGFGMPSLPKLDAFPALDMMMPSLSAPTSHHTRQPPAPQAHMHRNSTSDTNKVDFDLDVSDIFRDPH